MATQIGTTYNQVLGAVGDYYGVGSDQWIAIAQYGFNAENAESILSQVPDVSIYKNRAGEITGYAYNAPLTYDTGGIAGNINSNVQLPTQGNGNTFKASIPASGGTNQQTGNIDLTSGAKRASDNTTIPSAFSTVSTAIAGLSFGTRLGKNIVESLYKGNPDYWDKVLPTMNPQTWDTIAGDNELGKSVINAIFGIDKTTGQTQMYLPEDALAYYAYAMKEQGFFGTGSDEASIADTTGLPDVVVNAMPFSCGSAFNITETDGRYIDRIELDSGGASPIYYITTATPNISIYACSRSYAAGRTIQTRPNGETSSFPWRMYSSTINQKVVYYAPIWYTGTSPSDIASCSPAPNTKLNSAYISEMGYVALYGTITSGSREGVEQQDGAPTYNTSGWTDPAATAADLKANHPNLYDGSIYTDVPQPDGSTKRISYVPVNTTGTNGNSDSTPTNTEITYNNTVVNNSSPDDIIKTIIRYITETQTETKNDTPKPPDTPNPTDTGTGTIPPVVVPTGSASALWTVYNPTQAQLNSFGAWLWSSNFIDQILKLFNNPMQSIIGVHKIFASPSISGSNNITVGYLDSGVASNVVGNQYTTINCGSVNVREQFGNVFDYEETTIRLYLPFIGIVQLDTADVMRGTVSVVYHVDVITGACLAEVKISRDSGGGTLYQFSGDAAVRYPISSGSYMGVVSGVLGVVGGIASGIMSGGATLPMAAGAIAGGLSGAKTQVQHSGSFAGNAGAMGGKKPYLIIERPQAAVADGFESYQGKGANRVALVSSMSGYFKMTDIHTDSIAGAAESEIEAIRAALAGGVIA